MVLDSHSDIIMTGRNGYRREPIAHKCAPTDTQIKGAFYNVLGFFKALIIYKDNQDNGNYHYDYYDPSKHIRFFLELLFILSGGIPVFIILHLTPTKRITVVPSCHVVTYLLPGKDLVTQEALAHVQGAEIAPAAYVHEDIIEF